MAHPDNPKRSASYADLKQNIVKKMENGGEGIKDCALVNRALELVGLFLPRSPRSPANAFEEICDLQEDILRRHKEFCKNPHSHPYVRQSLD